MALDTVALRIQEAMLVRCDNARDMITVSTMSLYESAESMEVGACLLESS